MEVIFFGTGTSQGVPAIACHCPVCDSDDAKDKRLRSSILIKQKNTQVVIDAGPDFRQQMLRERIDHLDGILLTHGHKDHIGGLDDVRGLNQAMKNPIDIYASAEVQENIKSEFAYAFADFRYPGIPEFAMHLIDRDDFQLKDLLFTPLNLWHYKLPIHGFKTGSLVYITDTNKIPDEEVSKIKDCEVLIINALRIKAHISHFNLEQALEYIEKINPKKAYLTHISHQLGLHQEVEKILPEHVCLAYDGLRLSI